MGLYIVIGGIALLIGIGVIKGPAPGVATSEETAVVVRRVLENARSGHGHSRPWDLGGGNHLVLHARRQGVWLHLTLVPAKGVFGHLRGADHLEVLSNSSIDYDHLDELVRTIVARIEQLQSLPTDELAKFGRDHEVSKKIS